MKFLPWQPNYGNYFAEIYFVEKRVTETLNTLITEIMLLLCYNNIMVERQIRYNPSKQIKQLKDLVIQHKYLAH